MARRHMLARRLDVAVAVVEEDVGAKGLQERALVAAAEEQGLVKTHPQWRRVRMTRLCAGAERAVTRAVRIGEFSIGNALWMA